MTARVSAPPARAGRRRPRRGDGGLALALAAAIVLVAALYVSRERTFYAHDVGGYHDTAGGVAALWRRSPGAAWRAVAGSLGGEYNALYTLPLLPPLLLLGDSRPAYVTALALVYLLPFVLALGALGARLLPCRPRRAFWGTAALAALTPAAWVPTLRGYPDTGAALLLALAARAYLGDPALRRWWRAPAIGALLALAVLVRRHFAYAALAFLAALALLALLRGLREGRRAGWSWRPLRAAGWRLLAIALAGAGTLLLVAPAFVARALRTDYFALHRSYLHPPAALAGWAAASYGAVAWLAAVAGLGWLLRQPGARGAALFFAARGGLALAVWTLVVRQVDPHYTLHFTPVVVLGLAAGGLALWRRAAARVRPLALGAFGLWAVANLVVGLGLAPAAPAAPLRPLFAAAAPPLVHPDPEAVAHLVAYLRAAAPAGAPIYVAASSPTLSGDLLVQAERALYGRDGARLAVLAAPEVDSRDFYPLPPLLQARYVVVATPFQHHLPPGEQDVVRVAAALVAGEGAFARDFAPLPRRFAFAGGVTATIYARQRPTPRPTMARTLRLMQLAVGARPGGQPDWLVLDRGLPAGVTWDADRRPVVSAYPGPRDGGPATTLAHLGPRPPRATLTGRLSFRDPRCPGVALRLARLGPDGTLAPLFELARAPGLPETFAVTLPGPGEGPLLVEIVHLDATRGHPPCTLTLAELAVQPAAAGDGGG